MVSSHCLALGPTGQERLEPASCPALPSLEVLAWNSEHEVGVPLLGGVLGIRMEVLLNPRTPLEKSLGTSRCITLYLTYDEGAHVASRSGFTWKDQAIARIKVNCKEFYTICLRFD